MIRRVALLSAMALGIASLASAAPITYTHSGFGSGSLDGVTFGSLAPVAFTITATGDTDNRESYGPFLTDYFIDNDSASIEIEGVGTFAITTPTRFFSNDNVGLVGFSLAGIFGSDLFNGPGIAGWDMTTSIGPISGDGKVWWAPDVNTDGGALVFNRADSDATFEAVVGGSVPEPASLLLMGAGIALAVRRRARRA